MLSCAQAAFLRRGRRSPGFAGPWQSERGCRCSHTGINMRVYVRHTLTHTGIHMLTYIHRHTHKSTQAYTHIYSHAYAIVCMSACMYCARTHANPHRPQDTTAGVPDKKLALSHPVSSSSMSNSFAWTRNHQINTQGLDGADGTAGQRSGAREQQV